MKTDEDLFRDFLDGDDYSFELLIERYQNSLLSFIYKTLGAREKAEEIFQETFLRAFRFCHSFNPERKFKSWIYSIALHLCRDEIKRHKNQPATSSLNKEEGEYSLASESYRPDRPAQEQEMFSLVEMAMDRLSQKHREVLILHHYQGLKYEEIAEVLGRKVGTIKSQLHYAVQEMRKFLEPPAQFLYETLGLTLPNRIR